MILWNVKNKFEGDLRVPRREDGSERSRDLSSGGASGSNFDFFKKWLQLVERS